MSGSSGPTEKSAAGTYQGDNGDLLYKGVHEDIDVSMIDVRCRSGSCRVILEEAIWWQFKTRPVWNLGPGDRINEAIEVDSDLFDGNHRLSIIATADNTIVDVNWSSTDL